MKVQASLTLRNHAVIAKRKSLSMSQKDLADACGIAIGSVADIEKFNYERKNVVEIAQAIADRLDIPADSVIDFSRVGEKIKHSHVRVSDINLNQLGTAINAHAFIEASPADLADEAEQGDLINKIASAVLNHREKKILEARYGTGGCKPRTYDELAAVFKVTRERIRQVEARAIRKLHAPCVARRLGRDAKDEPKTIRSIDTSHLSTTRKKARPIQPSTKN